MLGGHAVYTATGGYTAVAAAAALYAQAINGRGQVVRVSVEQCLESLMEQAMLTYTAHGRATERRGLRGAVTAVSGSYRCADGYWMISVPSTPDGWASFVDWTQDPALMADPSLADEAERSAKQSFIFDRLEAWASALPKDELVTEAQRRHIAWGQEVLDRLCDTDGTRERRRARGEQLRALLRECGGVTGQLS